MPRPYRRIFHSGLTRHGAFGWLAKQGTGHVHILGTLLLVFAFLSAAHPAQAQATGALPEITFEVDEAGLDRMLRYPYSDHRAAVQVTHLGLTYEGELRIHGNTSRSLPKQSFRVHFESDENVFGRDVIVLRAEYRDASYVRNHVMHRLFRHLGFQTPDTRFVRLTINGEDQGIYLDVERINSAFLERRGLPRGDLYSLELNAGRWYPYMHESDVPIGWNARILTAGARERMAEALMQVGHSTYEDFPSVVQSFFDAEQVLRYYAVIYAVAGHDLVVDNHYVYQHPETGRFDFIPWDLDATLGANWDGGFKPTNATFKQWGYFHSVLLQRMLEYPHWQQAFAEQVEAFAGAGFDYLRGIVSEAAGAIRASVATDASTGRSPADFETAIQQIHSFLDQRYETLAAHEPFLRKPVTEIRVSDSLPSPDDPVVTFEVHSPEPQPLNLWLAYDLRFAEWSGTRREDMFLMYDDGTNGDREAGDGWYTAQVDLSPYMGHVVTVGAHTSGFYYPSPSFFSVHFRPSATYALNLTGTSPSAYAQLILESVVHAGGEVYVALRNESAESVDLTSFYLQTGPYYRRMAMPWGTNVARGGQVVVASSADGAEARFPDATVVGGLSFEVAEGDTLRFLTPMQTLMWEEVVEAESPELPRIVINEINYHSHDTLDTGDWLELHNPDDEAVSLAGWQIRDGDDDHVFVLPGDAVLPPGGFIVIAESAERLTSHVDVSGVVIDGLAFGFDAAGELVRVFNAAAELVESVAYSDDPPWPKAADGDGYTLERKDPLLPPDAPSSWAASLPLGGTPGFANSAASSEPVPSPPAFQLRALYPNPVHDLLVVTLDVPDRVTVDIVVYDVLGRELQRRVIQMTPGLEQTLGLNLTPYASGAYILSIEVDGQRLASRNFIRIR